MFRRIPIYNYIIFAINLIFFFSLTYYFLNHKSERIQIDIKGLKECQKDLKALRLYKGKPKCSKITTSNHHSIWLIIGKTRRNKKKTLI